MTEFPYDPEIAITYAHQWAFKRNPAYYDFTGLGGDCTNFISQCLYAAVKVMNYKPQLGWFYHSLNHRSPAWTGVPYLYNFLVGNQGTGPYGHEADLSLARPGDVIQMSFDGVNFTHTMLAVKVGAKPNPDNILIATHSYDADDRMLSSYVYKKHRLIMIDGARR